MNKGKALQFAQRVEQIYFRGKSFEEAVQIARTMLPPKSNS